ncbi:MAG: FecR domain-containing protein, partial [Myxococcota bacterium]
MSELDPHLDSIGDSVATLQDRVLEERPLPPLASPSRAPIASIAVGTLLVAAAAVVALVAWPKAPLSFEVDGVAGDVGAWIEGDRLSFSDGSAVELEGSSRVMDLSPDGATLSLERGTARVQVEHRSAETRWSVAAGPFQVRVVGTVFTLRWEPDERVLHLWTEEGVVEITGPVLAEATRVRAGQRVTVDLGSQRAELEDGVTSLEDDEPQASVTPSHPPIEVEEADLAPADVETVERTPRAPRPARAPTPWSELAANAQHREAIAAIDRAGLERILSRSNATETLLLADTLRVAGDARATEVYRRLRTRFPTTRAAARAAFMLGRMTQARDPAAAAGYYRACLQENVGPLRREAHGRWVEALSAAQDPGAREAARQYLAAYP